MHIQIPDFIIGIYVLYRDCMLYFMFYIISVSVLLEQVLQQF